MERLDPPMRAGEPSPSLGSSGRVALAVFALVAGYFLWTEHQAHVIQYFPWGLLALCPLMHLFMHRGHGAYGAEGSGPAGTPREPGA